MKVPILFPVAMGKIETHFVCALTKENTQGEINANVAYTLSESMRRTETDALLTDVKP